MPPSTTKADLELTCLEFIFMKLVSKLCLSWELGQGIPMGEVLEASIKLI
jgi:hypothetical protein